MGVAAGVLGNAAELLIALAMFAVGLYYFLCDGPKLLRAARELVPVQTEYQKSPCWTGSTTCCGQWC